MQERIGARGGIYGARTYSGFQELRESFKEEVAIEYSETTHATSSNLL